MTPPSISLPDNLQTGTIQEPHSPMQASPDSPHLEPADIIDTPQKPTPLPWAHLIVVFLIFVTDVLALTSLTPYLPFLVESFGLVHDRTKLGYYAGAIASSYYFSQLFSSIFWGWVSDRIGRRPVMLIGCFSSCVCTLAFGFSRTLTWALVCRLLYGALNGILGTMKTSLAEVTDKTNQGKAFSYIGLSFGIGQFVGPMIGGYLALPVETFPSLFVPGAALYPIRPFLEYFPFFLPNFFIFLVTLTGTMIGLFLLNESNRDVLERGERKKKAMDEKNLFRRVESLPDTPVGAEELVETPVAQPAVKLSWLGKLRQNEIFASTAPLTTSLIYATLGFNSVLFAEILPLWAVLPPKKWGINFDSTDLGVLMSISGVFILTFNLFILPRIISRYGALACLKWGSAIAVPFCAIFPEISFFFYPSPQMILVWGSLLFLASVRQATQQLQFSPIMICINNSVTYKSMGTINGISQSAVALTRAISPAVGGAAFAMSVNNNIPPFDVHLVWVWMGLNNLVSMALCYMLPDSINEPKVVPNSKGDESEGQKYIEMAMMSH